MSIKAPGFRIEQKEIIFRFFFFAPRGIWLGDKNEKDISFIETIFCFNKTYIAFCKPPEPRNVHTIPLPNLPLGTNKKEEKNKKKRKEETYTVH